MPKTTIFIGSSTAAKAQAKAFVKELTTPGIRFLPWWDSFTPGRTLLEELGRILNSVDAAIILFSPESKATIRKREQIIPNLNVLFEFGYFYGHLGKMKTAILKYGDFYLPTDLSGYIWIHGHDKFSRSRALKVTDRTKKGFTKWIEDV